MHNARITLSAVTLFLLACIVVALTMPGAGNARQSEWQAVHHLPRGLAAK